MSDLPQTIDSKLSPNIIELFKKGMQSYRHGDLAACVEIFQSIISTNPEIPEPHVNLGNSYFKLNKITEAINCWKKALTIDSTQVSCYVNLGNAYYSQNNVDEALKDNN